MGAVEAEFFMSPSLFWVLRGFPGNQETTKVRGAIVTLGVRICFSVNICSYMSYLFVLFCLVGALWIHMSFAPDLDKRVRLLSKFVLRFGCEDFGYTVMIFGG